MASHSASPAGSPEPPPLGSKRCNGPLCQGKFRPLEAFGPDERVPSGRQARCRDCCAETARTTARTTNAANRAAVFAHYGSVCACPGCGATEDLTIDHVNGDGGEHRKTGHDVGRIYAWLIRHGFPEGFQTMCWPCNRSKGKGPACRIDHAAPPGWKRCTGTCGPDGTGRTLPPEAFSIFAHNKRDGRHPRCRDCRKRRATVTVMVTPE